MYFKSKIISLTILLLTATICSSGAAIFLFDDLGSRTYATLIIGVIIYFMSLTTYLFNTSTKPTDIMNQLDPTGMGILQELSHTPFTGLKRVLFAVVIQIILAISFFLYLN